MINDRQQFYRVAALGSYFALLIHLLLWIIWLGPSHYFPTAMVLMVMVVPLLFPMRGLLHGRAYTHAWTGFLAILYFVHGVGDFFINPPERLYSGLEIVLSLTLFFSCAFYARITGKKEQAAAAERDSEAE